MAGTTKIGMVFGMIGVVLILAPNIKQSMDCTSAALLPATKNITQSGDSLMNTSKPLTPSGDIYTCMSAKEIFLALLSLLFASILWGAMSGIFSFFCQFYGCHVRYILFVVKASLFVCMFLRFS